MTVALNIKRRSLIILTNFQVHVLLLKDTMQYTLKMARCSRLLNKHNIVAQHMRGLQLSSLQNKQNMNKLLPQKEEFQARHIGPREHEQIEMLKLIGFKVICF